MAYFQFEKEQIIPAGITQVWDYISRPENLKEITPAHMGFIVTSKTGGQKMYPGMIITYKVSPFLGIPLNWVTEITHIKEHEYFVDEQKIGPYNFWQHQHRIVPVQGGVLMTDIVTYQPPLWFLGTIANSLFIGKQLEKIFAYRETILREKRW